MKFQTVFVSALLVCAGIATAPAMAAEECGPLKQLADIQMLTAGGDRNLVPVTINGAPKLMILTTGWDVSAISDATAKELRIPLRDTLATFFNIAGKEFHQYAVVDSLQLGPALTEHRQMLVFPSSDSSMDGNLANDVMLRYDMDIDFGSGRLKYFSPDHCPGNVVYWSPPAVAAIPITIEDRARIIIPVTLDGKEVKAVIDTGDSRSLVTQDWARRYFDLTPQSPGVEKAGNVNGNPRLQNLAYTFHTLSFGGVDVHNLRASIIPYRSNSPGPLPQPDLAIGTDVLQHLHIYLAAKERVLYVSEGSPPRKPPEEMAWLDEALAASPTNAGLRNTRCFLRAFKKADLPGALEDCEIAMKERPDSAYIADSNGFVLYQLGRYKEALDTYNRALARDSEHAASLYVRGHAKKKLGDMAGGDADIAAAKALNSNIENNFKDAGLSN